MKTYSVKLTDIKREMHVVDVADKILGRVATEIASLLMGKHKPTMSRNVDMGDSVTVINASPMGMTGKQRMDPAILDALPATSPDALIFDMVYAPLETELLARGRLAGRHAVDGLTMLIGQADLAFGLFFNAGAPRECDAELRRLLTA